MKAIPTPLSPFDLLFQMKIIADKNMPMVAETFGRHGEIQFHDGRQISRSDLEGAELLLVRSITRVDQGLLAGTAIRFVGSATIGLDHLDTNWLESNNIVWANAPGCNADAAAQYTLAMMWLACQRLQRDFRQQTVGIIGRGNVGRRLEFLLQTLDIPVMACDPPLADEGELGLVSMDTACANSIISLHVPLTANGVYPTRNLLDRNRLANLQPNTLVVNASRGGVIESTALLQALKQGHLNAALDVWPEEPYIDRELLDAVTVASPHIAGYSVEGKNAGTEMIYQAFCRAFPDSSADQPGSTASEITMRFSDTASIEDILQQVLNSSCPVARDDRNLRALTHVSAEEERIQFDGLRAGYPERHEFKMHRILGVSGLNADLLRCLGCKTA